MADREFLETNGVRFEWLGQSTVRITTPEGYCIYTDPVLLDQDPPPADLILITHHHVDHCLPEYVSAIRNDATAVGAFYDSYIKYCPRDIKKVKTIRIGETADFSGKVRVTGLPAYTSRGFHIKGEGCGFLIEIFSGQKVRSSGEMTGGVAGIREKTGLKKTGLRIYFSGDTGKIPEMEGLGNIDVAIVSFCDDTYQIKPEEIVQAVRVIRPKFFIPVHYTPPYETQPQPEDGMFAVKDPRFFTRKEDPSKFLKDFEGTGIEVTVLRKIGKTFSP